MSRSDAPILSNPSKSFAQWKSIYKPATDKLGDPILDDDGEKVMKLKGGTFVYWDKEKEQNVEIELPYTFAVLNPDLVTFKGYNEKLKQGVWSNEVSDPEHVVKIRNKFGLLMEFKLKDYKNVKDEVAGHFAKYTRSVYIATPNGEIHNLQLSGAAASGGNDKDDVAPEDKNDGWFGFSRVNKANLYKKWIVVGDSKKKKKGKVTFTVPIFETSDLITDDQGAELDKLDTQLKEFLAYYFQKPEVKKEEPVAEVADTDDEDEYDN